jgi:eukaryotic-like serine/threonine-protein kinase
MAITIMTVPLLFSSIFSEQQAPALTQKRVTPASTTRLSHTLNNNSVGTTSNSDFLIYENSTFGIKIQYPSDWLKNTTDQGVTFVLPAERNSSNPENFLAKLDAATIAQVPASASLKELADGVLNGYRKSLPNFQLESYGNTTAGGNPAVKIVYMFTGYKDGNLKATDIATIKNSRLYIIQYYVQSKYQNYMPMLQKMVESFTIIK